MEADPVAGQAGHTHTLQEPGTHSRHSPVLGADILTTFTSFESTDDKLLSENF